MGLYVRFVLSSLSFLLPLPIFGLKLTRLGSILLLILSFLRDHAKGKYVVALVQKPQKRFATTPSLQRTQSVTLIPR
jgi:hypothetical protein